MYTLDVIRELLLSAEGDHPKKKVAFDTSFVYIVCCVCFKTMEEAFYLLLMCYKLLHCQEIPCCDMSVRMEKLGPH
jgi:hypothetical protein